MRRAERTRARAAALTGTLALLEPVVLRQGARRKALLCGLEDSDKDVRVAAVKAVARLQTLVYFGHGDQHTSCTELPSTVLVSDVGEDKQQTVSDGTGSGATWRQTVGAPKKREPAQQRPPLPQVQASRNEGPAALTPPPRPRPPRRAPDLLRHRWRGAARRQRPARTTW